MLGERLEKPARDRDSVSTAFLSKTLTWFSFPAAAAFVLALIVLRKPLLALGISAAVFLAQAAVWFVVIWPAITGTSSWISRAVSGADFHEAGVGPPPWSDSRALALIQQRQYREAAQEYLAAIARAPQLVEPYLKLASLFERELHQPRQAAEWYRKARSSAKVTPEQDTFIALRLADLYEERLGRIEQARAELGRIVRLYPDSAQGRAARKRLADLKRREGRRGDPA